MLLGAGEGLVNGTPLEELGGRAKPLMIALRQAAASLQEGSGIPHSASAGIAANVIPPWLYLLIASIVWRIQARTYKAQRHLRARPYDI
jgi:hypothetical protein